MGACYHAWAWWMQVLIPLVAGAALYGLLYTPHRSWYSWLIASLANGMSARSGLPDVVGRLSSNETLRRRCRGLCLWLCPHDPAALYQLPPQERCPHALEGERAMALPGGREGGSPFSGFATPTGVRPLRPPSLCRCSCTRCARVWKI
jgi:hypothetical protein